MKEINIESYEAKYIKSRREIVRQRRCMIRQRRMILALSGMVMLLVVVLIFYLNRTTGVALSNDITNSEQNDESIIQGQDNISSTSDIDDKEKLEWNLQLVNAQHPMAEDYQCELVDLINGHKIDQRCYEDLQDMMDDCRENGMNPLICSSYRSYEKQTELFEEMVNEYLGQGYTKEDAEIEAGKSVAIPGTSEHQLGLAVDIVSMNNQVLDESQEDTLTQKWLMKNSWKYGFILRYPTDKTEITGIIYEPWHYRYVGKDAAKEMYEQEVCLEEYVSSLLK